MGFQLVEQPLDAEHTPEYGAPTVTVPLLSKDHCSSWPDVGSKRRMLFPTVSTTVQFAEQPSAGPQAWLRLGVPTTDVPLRSQLLNVPELALCHMRLGPPKTVSAAVVVLTGSELTGPALLHAVQAIAITRMLSIYNDRGMASPWAQRARRVRGGVSRSPSPRTPREAPGPTDSSFAHGDHCSSATTSPASSPNSPDAALAAVEVRVRVEPWTQ
jgi:hypothetical protein